jgi:ribose/xylose/arabinose/galactoside ABC-type transport system permease subunit
MKPAARIASMRGGSTLGLGLLLLGLAVGCSRSTRPDGPEILTVVKVSGIPWFNRMEEGVRQAARELGIDAYQIGPSSPSASALGVAPGLINAALIHGPRAPSIIITLATLNLYQGLLTGLSGGRWVYELPPWFQRLGTWQLRLWPGAPPVTDDELASR